MRRKAREKESHAWCQVDVKGVVPDCCNSQTLRWSASSLPNNELYWRCLSNVTVSNSWIRYYKKDLMLGTAPLTSTLISIWHYTRDSISQAFPLHFSILQVIKGGNGLGTRLLAYCMLKMATSKRSPAFMHSLIHTPPLLYTYLAGTRPQTWALLLLRACPRQQHLSPLLMKPAAVPPSLLNKI